MVHFPKDSHLHVVYCSVSKFRICKLSLFIMQQGIENISV
jgi:hypothetical protein